jgi:AraC family transcriptional regulator
MLSQASPNASTSHRPIPGDFNLLWPTLTKLLDDASSAVERDASTVRLCLAQAMSLLEAEGFSVDRGIGLPANGCGLAPWQARRVTAHIEEHLDARIRVSELAVLSRLSVSYFSVAFRRSFGASVQTFVARQRVERAKVLMLSTVQPLSEIALACGFCDQAHLCRQFRRITGGTPRSWRHRHIGQSLSRVVIGAGSATEPTRRHLSAG